MKKKTLAIKIPTAAHFESIKGTSSFEAMVTVARLLNALDLVLEATDRHIADTPDCPKRLRPAVVILHRLCTECDKVCFGFIPTFIAQDPSNVLSGWRLRSV